MTITTLITFHLATLAFTYILTREFITKDIRAKFKNKWLKELINCPFCIGFWSGWIFFAISPYPFWVSGLCSYAFIKIVGTWIENNTFRAED